MPGTGLLAACVPGAFGALAEAARRPRHVAARRRARVRDRLRAPRLPALGGSSARSRGVADLFATEWTTSAEVWLPAAARGRLHAQPAARRDLRADRARGGGGAGDRDEQIEHARAAFYEGFVAEAIVGVHGHRGARRLGRAAPRPADRRDLAGWRAAEEPPATFDYRGHTVCKTGPWGQGPVFLQQLALLEGSTSTPRRRAPTYVHTVIEAPSSPSPTARRTTATRLVDVPLDDCCSAAYAAERRELIGDPASLDLRPGPRRRPPTRLRGATRRRGRLAPAAGAARASGEPTRGDTCHLDVADRHGNLVSATPSGGWLQSSPAVPGLGFPLGTRGADVLARRGPPGLAGAGQAPAHHAVAVARAARRPALDGLRHAGRRPAGPVVAHCLPLRRRPRA